MRIELETVLFLSRSRLRACNYIYMACEYDPLIARCVLVRFGQLEPRAAEMAGRTLGGLGGRRRMHFVFLSFNNARTLGVPKKAHTHTLTMQYSVCWGVLTFGGFWFHF